MTKLNLSGRRRVLVLSAIVAAVLFFWLERRFLVSSKLPPQRGFNILDTVVKHIREDYLKEADPRKTMEGGYQGLVGSLDPMSAYLAAPSAARAASPKKAELFDSGLILYKRPGLFALVVGIVPGSPAEKVDIKAGDFVSGLDDRSTLIWSQSEIGLYLKGAGPGPVKLRLIRDNETRELSLERGRIYARAATWSPQKETAGIVRVHHLHPPLVEEFKSDVLPKLGQAKGPIVLDLRDCFEGEMEEARRFLNLFLKSEAIGYLEKRGGAKETLACPSPAPLDGRDLVVWIGPASMGPAEMVAGVLKDARKARLVGFPTVGLASRQELFGLANGDALLLTTGIFALPSGEKIWEKGVEPDAKLEGDRRDTKAYLEKTIGPSAGR